MYPFLTMAPTGYAIIVLAGAKNETWFKFTAAVAQQLADTRGANLAVAIIGEGTKSSESSLTIWAPLKRLSNNGVIRIFSTATTPKELRKTLPLVAKHEGFSGLKLELAIYHVVDKAKQPFLETTLEECTGSVELYISSLFVFTQVALEMMYQGSGGQTLLSETKGAKKGTIIIQGSPRAMKGTEKYAVHNAGKAGARILMQSVAQEHSRYGIHCVHAIINGPMTTENQEAVQNGRMLDGEAVGKAYLWLSSQPTALWTHKLDLRPAQAQFST